VQDYATISLHCLGQGWHNFAEHVILMASLP